MKTKSPKDMQSVPAGIGIGVLVSVIITLVSVSVFAWLLSAERLSETALGYGVVVILVLATITGAGVAVSILKNKRVLISVLTGVGYFLVLLACTALLFGGQYQGVGETALVILAGSISVGLTGLKGDKKRSPARYKYKNR